MTPMGTLPISFELEGKSLAEAIAKFSDAARVAMEDAMRELQQLRREAASSIVIPEPGAVPPAGGGRIRMP
jgi:cell division GTPase FtsZ